MQARYQYGNLILRKRKNGPDVWQFLWMENGRLKSILIGTIEKYPSRAHAERAVEHLRMKINAENPQQHSHHATVTALIERFMQEYVPSRCRRPTQKLYRSLFENHVKPKWGTEFVSNVKTMAVENWLEQYPHSSQIKSHVRNLMHMLGQAEVRRAMREQTYRRLIQIAAVLFEANDRMPAGLLQQIDGALRVKGIQEKDVKKAAAIEAGQTRQEAKRRRLFAFAGPQPLDGEKRFDRAVNHLTTDGAVIVLSLLDPAAGRILTDHAAL
jgi:hypothetical protein